jgi:hypothetical protein
MKCITNLILDLALTLRLKQPDEMSIPKDFYVHIIQTFGLVYFDHPRFYFRIGMGCFLAVVLLLLIVVACIISKMKSKGGGKASY